jgi:hypothetical protein
MSTSRPKLTLDEQSFQDMLAAAFTIQEHNAQRRKNAQPPPLQLCGQCGVPVQGDRPLCEKCAVEARPGEELQRKWASLWLMSQEQGLWPDRSAEVPDPIHVEPSMSMDEPHGADPRAANLRSDQPRAENVHSVHIPFPNIADARPVPLSIDAISEEIEREGINEDIDTEINQEPPSEAESFDLEPAWPAPSSTELRILPELDVSQLAGDGADEADLQETSSQAVAIPPKSLRDLRLRDLRLTLRFHRADFYLVLAIAVSTIAMVWVLSATPAPGAQRKPRLRPWERALISMGLAEAPEPPPRRGNPNISVWVDPKTALYYCAGEELYGKAPGGHLATQREAQLDQFEPASRAACE